MWVANPDGRFDAQGFVWLNGSSATENLNQGIAAAVSRSEDPKPHNLPMSRKSWRWPGRRIRGGGGEGSETQREGRQVRTRWRGRWQQRTLTTTTAWANLVLDLTRVPTSAIMGTESEP